jgi:Bifunctional DNA primase/polymerase, N-terminal
VTLTDPVAAMLNAALDLASQGWALFPCHWSGPRAKSPLTVHGHLDASRDPEVIRAWWTRWPKAMIGAPVPESLAVIDGDPRNGGKAAVLERGGPLPPTLTVWSGRGDGGRHLYFRRPAGPLTSTRLPAGFDLKVAGYLIMPPSIHPVSGQPYRWEHRPVASMPPHLRELLRPPPPPKRTRPRKPGTGEHLVRFVDGLQEGNRNRGLFWAARCAVEGGVLDDLGESLVSAAVRCGLPEVEARRTVGSARRGAPR